MKIMKRALAAVIALALMMTAVGCSTPKDAAKVGNIEISTGEYLAYLYMGSLTAATGDSKQNIGIDFLENDATWDMTTSYTNTATFKSDEETSDTATAAKGTDMKLEDAAKQAAKDMILYSATLQTIADENGIKVSDEKMKELDNAADSLLTSWNVTYEDLMSKGISEDSFKKMLVKTNYLDKPNYLKDAVFTGLYGTNGKTPTKAADIDKYFADNYVAYAIISEEISSDGVDYTDEEIAEVKKELEGYRNVFYATGNFDDACDAHTIKHPDSNGATAAEPVELDKEKYNVDYDGEPAKNVTSNRSNNIVTADVTKFDELKEYYDVDELKEFYDVVKGVKVGTADIVEFTVDSTKWMALIYRYDIQKVELQDSDFTVTSDTAETVEPTYKSLRESVEDAIITALHEDDFNKLAQKKLEELTKSASFNERTVKMCSPKKLFK